VDLYSTLSWSHF